MRHDLDLERFKSLLEQRRKTIEESLGALRESSAPVELDQSRVGRLSRMDSMQQQAMAQESVRRAEQELMRIEKALQRMEAGEYGYCVSCEEEIGERRLQVLPDSLVCIECANKR